ncbi:peptide-N-glycosidase F-related protein [Flavobacterium sp.]|uniref:peptide-N-glycosidase F-related protein n=1 Tax=Flavobacterium sp. TaxID=239 RepID=UPI0040484982
MKKISYYFLSSLILYCVLFNVSCTSDNSPSESESVAPLSPTPTSLNFQEIMLNTFSVANFFKFSSTGITNDIIINSPSAFLISSDNSTYTNSITLSNTANQNITIYVKFAPTELGSVDELITINSLNRPQKTVQVKGIGIPRVYNYQTFLNARSAFGAGLNQTNTETFVMHNDVTNIEKIYAYIKLKCPTGGCNAWDVFANIKVKDPQTNDWYEIARYITPYGKNNEQVSRGFKVDVTDFKSLLTGTVELKSFVEVWGNDGWLVSVDFDYIEGTPDYKYYAVSSVVQYNQNSLEGVVYGEDASAFDLTKTVQIPSNSQATSLRTVITGWGHATPNDPDGRPCAEWCYRTHKVKINSADTFSHYLGPIGCNSNPVQPQGGNWSPDRAGWCPGMGVPVRTDNLTNSFAGQSFDFEYEFEHWVNDLLSTNSNIHAYYAISTFVVVKSDTPIVKPTVN